MKIAQSIAFGAPGIQELLVIGLIIAMTVFVNIVPFWYLFKRTGLSPYLSLFGLIPFGALVLPFIAAFCPWPTLDNH